MKNLVKLSPIKEEYDESKLIANKSLFNARYMSEKVDHDEY